MTVVNGYISQCRTPPITGLSKPDTECRKPAQIIFIYNNEYEVVSFNYLKCLPPVVGQCNRQRFHVCNDAQSVCAAHPVPVAAVCACVFVCMCAVHLSTRRRYATAQQIYVVLDATPQRQLHAGKDHVMDVLIGPPSV